MKRILLIFALLSAIVLPAQLARADSFTGSSDLLAQLQSITGKNAVNLFGSLPGAAQYFDIAVLYASGAGDPFAGSGDSNHGLNVLRGVLTQDFFASLVVNESASSSGTPAVYEYNGSSVALPGGTIFVSASLDNTDYVFAVALSSKSLFGTPAPAALLLFGSGAAGIVALRRKLR